MGYHENGQPQSALQGPDQFVEIAGADRVQPRGRLVEEHKFRVEREKRESERKKIEAEGIREFQTIVSQGISDSYLRWKGIEATLRLAQSPNTKIVVIGSGKDGLPIILNADALLPEAQPSAAATKPAATPPPTN